MGETGVITDKMHLQIPFHTLASASCWISQAATQHTLARVCERLYIHAQVCQHMHVDKPGRSEKAKHERDEGSRFWLKYNLWRSHSMSWQPSVNPGGERAELLWSNTQHTHTRTDPNTNTERLHQHREAQTDRWANSWLTVCYETLSLCQWNQNNILGVNAGLVTANRTPHGRDACMCTVTDGGGGIWVFDGCKRCFCLSHLGWTARGPAQVCQSHPTWQRRIKP